MRKNHLKQFSNVSSIFASDLYIKKLGEYAERESERNTERIPNPTLRTKMREVLINLEMESYARHSHTAPKQWLSIV